MNADEAETRRAERLRERRTWEAVGLRIRKARIARNLSVEDLAEQVGLMPQTLYRIEVGAVGTTISRLIVFATVLALDVADLLDLPDEVDRARPVRLAVRGRQLTAEQAAEIARFVDALLPKQEN